MGHFKILRGLCPLQKIDMIISDYPSRELTYPTLGKGESSSKVPFGGDMLVP